MGGIFLCYRRDDTRGSAGRLYGDLREKLDPHPIFRDLDAIEAGADFAVEIAKTVEHCDALIALIGTGWLGATDARGRRRLEDPSDLVRTEIAAALAAGTTVIPVLVEDATMPAGEDLPQPLRPLAARNALPISDLRWDYDVQRLVSRLQRLLARTAEADVTPGFPPAQAPVPSAPTPTPVLPAPAPAPAPVRNAPIRFAPVIGAFVAGIAVVLLVLVRLGTFDTSNGGTPSGDVTNTTVPVTFTPSTLSAGGAPVSTAPSSSVKSFAGSSAKITKTDGTSLLVDGEKLRSSYCGIDYGLALKSGQRIPFENMSSVDVQTSGNRQTVGLTLIKGDRIDGELDCGPRTIYGENSVGDVVVELKDVLRIDLRQ